MISMHKRVLLIAFAAAVLAIFIVGCGRGTVAVVNGRKITRQEYYNRLEHLPVPAAQGGQQREAGSVILQQLVDEELILRLAEKENVSPSEEQVKERMAQVEGQRDFARQLESAGITRDQFKERMHVEQAAFNIQTKGVTVTEKEVRKFYEDNKDTAFTIPEHAAVAAIFTKTLAKANEATSLLKRGVDFATVAQSLSVEKNSAERGGVLARPIIRGDNNIPKSVQDLVLSTPRNKYTKPIDGGETYIIFKVLRHNPKRVQPFKEVKFNIRQQLMVKKGIDKKINLDEKLAKFKKTADVDVRIERYKEQLFPKEEQKPTNK